MNVTRYCCIATKDWKVRACIFKRNH